MNTRPAIESSNNPAALSASFNGDASCFAVGLETGFRGKTGYNEPVEKTADVHFQFSTRNAASNGSAEVSLLSCSQLVALAEV